MFSGIMVLFLLSKAAKNMVSHWNDNLDLLW